MGKKSKSAKSRAKNLGFYSKKRARVTIEDEDEVNDSVQVYDSELPVDPEPLLKNSDYSERGFVFEDADGSLTLMGFLQEEECLPDFAADSDSESDHDDDSLAEVDLLSDLEQFTKILVEAQRIAVEAENERLKECNRPKHYFRNSARTKRRHKRIRKDLENQGYFSIKNYFLKPKSTAEPDSESLPDSDHDVEMTRTASAVDEKNSELGSK